MSPDDFRADRQPSAQHATDAKTVFSLRDDTEPLPAAQLWDFLEPDTLDYGYMFAHDANGEKANESMDPQYPVMADSNPYIRAGMIGDKVPAASNKLNSHNHLQEGQNILFGDMHVTFSDKPTVGVGGDNIYTAWYSRPAQDGSPDVPGTAPQAIGGGAGELPTNYHFDIVSRTDAMLLP